MDDSPPLNLDDLWTQLTDLERKAVGEDLSEHEGVGVEARLAKLIRHHHKRGTDTGRPRPTVSLHTAQLRSATPANPGQQSVDTLWAELSEHERLAVSEDLEEQEGADVEARFGKLVRRHHLRAASLGVVRGRSQEQLTQSGQGHSENAAFVDSQPSRPVKTEGNEHIGRASIDKIPRGDSSDQHEANLTDGRQQSIAPQSQEKHEQPAIMVSGSLPDQITDRDQGILTPRQDTNLNLPVQEGLITVSGELVSAGPTDATKPLQHLPPSSPKTCGRERMAVDLENQEHHSPSQARLASVDRLDRKKVKSTTTQVYRATSVQFKEASFLAPPSSMDLSSSQCMEKNNKATGGSALSENLTATSQPAAATLHAPASSFYTPLQTTTLGRDHVSTPLSKRMPEDLEDKQLKRARTEAVTSSEIETSDTLSKTDTNKIEDGLIKFAEPNKTINAGKTSVNISAQSSEFPPLSGDQSGSTTISGNGSVKPTDAASEQDGASKPMSSAQAMNTLPYSRPENAESSIVAHSSATGSSAVHATSGAYSPASALSMSSFGPTEPIWGGFGSNVASSNYLGSATHVPPHEQGCFGFSKTDSVPSLFGAAAFQKEQVPMLSESTVPSQNHPPPIKSDPHAFGSQTSSWGDPKAASSVTASLFGPGNSGLDSEHSTHRSHGGKALRRVSWVPEVWHIKPVAGARVSSKLRTGSYGRELADEPIQEVVIWSRGRPPSSMIKFYSIATPGHGRVVYDRRRMLAV